MRCTALLLCLLSATAMVCAADTEPLGYESATYTTWAAFNEGRPEGRPRIGGTLLLPPGAARGPAVVILHGGSGSSASEHNAARALVDAGIAALLVDQLASRGSGGPRLRISNMSHTADALHALRALRSHPRIDADRIGILGFSLGGIGTIASNSRALTEVIAGPGVKFAAHAAVYPVCVTTQHGPAASTGAPMLLLVGGRDQSTPARACEDLEAIHRETGTNSQLRLVRYEGAEHAWDNPDAGPGQFVPQQGNGSECPMTSLSPQGEILMRKGAPTRKVSAAEVAAAFQSCATSGARVGYSAAIARESTAAWLDFFRKELLR